MDRISTWIMADMAFAGTVRFAHARIDALALHDQSAFSTEAFPTFSDALLGYARQVGIDLRSAGCVLSLPGPTAGNTIRVARSRWTLSRSGLGGMFGGPLAILNDVVATAWSLSEVAATGVEPLGRASRPDLTRAGRWVAILLDDGVGAATLTIGADGRMAVADTEIGHIGFSPADEREFALMQTLRGYRHAVSWEQVLARPPDSRAGDATQWAAIAGGFAGDVLLATAAWSGIILCGRRATALMSGAACAAFLERATSRAAYGRFIEQAEIGLLVAREPLRGCLAYLRGLADGATQAAPRAPHPRVAVAC